MVISDSDYLTTALPVTIFVLLAVKAALSAWNMIKFNRKFKHLPQEPSHWLWGDLQTYPGRNDEGLAYQRKMTEKFPRFRVAWIGPYPELDITHPDLIKIILKSSEPKNRMFNRFIEPWLGQGLVTSDGPRWSRSRRLLIPAFHSDILKSYIQMKNNLCNDLLEKFENSSKSGESIDAFANVSLFTLDVILQSAMSYETGCQKDGDNHPYIAAVNRIMTAIVDRCFKPWLYQDFIYYLTPTGRRFLQDCRFVHGVAEEVIAKRRKDLESNEALVNKERSESTEKKRKNQDFLDTLLTARDEDGNGLTDREVRDQVDTFLFAGHDTTASSISWALFSIAEHPDVQCRVQEELDDLLGDRDSDYLTREDINKLPYLTKVLKESMRLHSPVPEIARQLTKDIVLDGYTIPEGVDININMYCNNHNPTIWTDSMKFDPERFSPSNSEGRDSFSFIPFSAGPRNCIGQNFAMSEMKLTLARILRRYEISLDPNHKVSKNESLVMKAENDIKLVVKTRQIPTCM